MQSVSDDDVRKRLLECHVLSWWLNVYSMNRCLFCVIVVRNLCYKLANVNIIQIYTVAFDWGLLVYYKLSKFVKVMQRKL